MNFEKPENFRRLLLLVAAFFTVLILFILTTYVWVPQIEEKKENAQQGESLAASVYDTEKEDTHEGREVLSDKENGADHADSPEEKPAEKISNGNFQVTMSTEWNYPDTNTPAEDSYVENSSNNSYETIFKIVLADDESVVLYKSPRMPIGSFVTGIPLKAELYPGTYKCVVVYSLYAPGSDDESGKVRVGLTINIG